MSPGLAFSILQERKLFVQKNLVIYNSSLYIVQLQYSNPFLLRYDLEQYSELFLCLDLKYYNNKKELVLITINISSCFAYNGLIYSRAF